MEAIRIGIIDDDESRAVILRLSLDNYISDLVGVIPFSEYFNAPEISLIPLDEDIETIVSRIKDDAYHCVLLDYNLQSQSNVQFNGVDLAKRITSSLYEFPIFILTSYEDLLFQRETFNTYQVFNTQRFFSAQNGKHDLDGMQKRVVNQVITYRRRMREWREELNELLKKNNRTALEDSRLLELDTFIERSLDADNALPKKTKEDVSGDNFIHLIEKIDALINRYGDK